MFHSQTIFSQLEIDVFFFFKEVESNEIQKKKTSFDRWYYNPHNTIIFAIVFYKIDYTKRSQTEILRNKHTYK